MSEVIRLLNGVLSLRVQRSVMLTVIPIDVNETLALRL